MSKYQRREMCAKRKIEESDKKKRKKNWKNYIMKTLNIKSFDNFNYINIIRKVECILVSNKINFRTMKIIRDKEGYL